MYFFSNTNSIKETHETILKVTLSHQNKKNV